MELTIGLAPTLSPGPRLCALLRWMKFKPEILTAQSDWIQRAPPNLWWKCQRGSKATSLVFNSLSQEKSKSVHLARLRGKKGNTNFP